MKFTSGLTVCLLALSNVATCEAPSRRWTGSLSARANAASLTKRQIEIGGLKLGGGGNQTTKGQAGKGNGGGLTIGGLTLGGPGGGITSSGGQKPAAQGQKEGGATAEGQKPAAEKPLAGATPVAPAGPAVTVLADGKNSTAPTTPTDTATETQPGRSEGEAAKKEGEQAQQEAAAQKGEQASPAAAAENGGQSNKATEESERFSEGFGITLDEAGNAVNSGGNLGITQGSDGSKSVGGENGINISKTGVATIKGNETQ